MAAASFQCMTHSGCIVCSGRAGAVLVEVAVEFDRCFVLVGREGVDESGQCKLKLREKPLT